jgi:hypothetical protein
MRVTLGLFFRQSPGRLVRPPNHAFVLRNGAWTAIPRDRLDLFRSPSKSSSPSDSPSPTIFADVAAAGDVDAQEPDAFPTLATRPVGTSFQEIQVQNSPRIATPLPAEAVSSATITPPSSFSFPTPKTVIAGVEIPQKPRAPDSDECCMSGTEHRRYATV